MATLLLLVALATTLNVHPSLDLATDPRTMTLSWELLEKARYGRDTKEHAAFLMRDAGGELRLAEWPWGAESTRATYHGEVPAGTVAIVHTHPGHLPNPSPGDAALSRRLSLPVYVLTRGSVTRTDGARMETVAVGDWNPRR